jgi:hypothetical protein
MIITIYLGLMKGKMMLKRRFGFVVFLIHT